MNKPALWLSDRFRLIFIPSVLFFLLAPWTPYLDLRISHAFYDPQGRFITDTPFNWFFFYYGDWPAWGVFWISLGIYFLSFLFRHWKAVRKEAIMLVLTFGIGTGLIINVILKEHWGRPRPRQITDFGGNWPYTPFYYPQFGYYSLKSFPSGHAAAGFFFLAIARIGFLRKNKFLMYSGIFATIVLGISLSLCRISMGGHFFSDIVASALIMWIVVLCLEYFLGVNERADKKTA